MKYAIPLGTLFLLGAGLVLHRTPPIPARTVGLQERPPKADVRAQVWESLSLPSPPRPTVPPPSDPELKPQASASGTRKVAPSLVGKMMASLDRDLALAEIQRAAVERLLKDREAEIHAWHESIIGAGVVDIRQFDWQADRLKESWYLKIDALLDRVQHERFVALVQQGFLNEGVAFTVEPGMTVLD